MSDAIGFLSLVRRIQSRFGDGRNFYGDWSFLAGKLNFAVGIAGQSPADPFIPVMRQDFNRRAYEGFPFPFPT